jgi:Uncharacterized protein conserved in bacteria (DUF2252)
MWDAHAMDVVAATRAYEDWLGDQLEVVSEDLDRKHKRMRESPFVFLRGSYYRWLQRIDALATDLAGPQLACVGDLHVENFGTWRDSEGRLVWGINDFDESERLPYTYDLARLATSAVLAIDEGILRVRRRAACDAILEGYRDSLAQGGGPFVLAGEHEELANLVAAVLAPGPAAWWKDLFDDELLKPSPRHDRIPDGALAALTAVLPGPNWVYEVRRRVAGVGSLGRRRLVLVGDHGGAPVARELKQLAPPAGVWLGRAPSERVSIAAAVRSGDPFVDVADGWTARRIAPDCVKLDLAAPEGQDAERRLLSWMGGETANIHLASGNVIALVRDDLDRRERGWLHKAVTQLARATRDDHGAWRKKSSGQRNHRD